jgi:hypothetical protein
MAPFRFGQFDGNQDQFAHTKETASMFPWLRLFRVGLSLIGKSQVDLLATTRVRLRVWPNDLDFNLHVNNSRYLALADIGSAH